MKRILMVAAAIAGLLASCTSEESSIIQNSEQTVWHKDANKGLVQFGAYMSRGITRAGMVGELTPADGDHNLQSEGFGVFGYYTDQQDYDKQTSYPNFMHNQQVAYNSSSRLWEYMPVKYWPNEYGSDAESMDIDKISFFAYAPFVPANSANGKLNAGNESYGITAVSRNTNSGDPLIYYKSSFSPTEAVDLCWGVVGSSVDAAWKTVQDNGVQDMQIGFPWKNVQRPGDVSYGGQRVKFTFVHALAQLNVQIDADPDVTQPTGTAEIADKTKVYVRSITISGLARRGALNLNNTIAREPLWQSFNGVGSLTTEEVTIYDGRRNDKEGIPGAENANEVLACLNPDIISNDGNTSAGVTRQPQNLFKSSSLTDAIYVIPTGEPMNVTIDYDVETEDPLIASTLSDGVTSGTSIANRVSKEISFGDKHFIEAGRKYTLLLHLGLNSVKFDSSVSEWIDKSDDSSSADSWLPGNDKENTKLSLSVNGESISSNGRSKIVTLGSGDITHLTVMTNPVDLEGVWSNSDPSVAHIVAGPAGTRAAAEEVRGTKSIYITPVGVGSTIITFAAANEAISFAYTVMEPEKPQAVIKTAPVAIENLVYNASAQKLITAGSSEQGTVEYALGSVSGPTSAYSATIPTAINAGNYHVWYKVVGDADHTDSTPQRLTVTVAKADATLTLAAGDLSFAASDKADAAKTKAITAKAGDKTVTVSSGDNTKCTVAVSGTTITVTRKSTDIFSDVVITVTLMGDANHNDATATFKVSAEQCPTALSGNSGINDWNHTDGNNQIDLNGN